MSGSDPEESGSILHSDRDLKFRELTLYNGELVQCLLDKGNNSNTVVVVFHINNVCY